MMQAVVDQLTQSVGAYIPNLIGAVAILVLGWLIALVVAALVDQNVSANQEVGFLTVLPFY